MEAPASGTVDKPPASTAASVTLERETDATTSSGTVAPPSPGGLDSLPPHSTPSEGNSTSHQRTPPGHPPPSYPPPDHPPPMTASNGVASGVASPVLSTASDDQEGEEEEEEEEEEEGDKPGREGMGKPKGGYVLYIVFTPELLFVLATLCIPN